MIRFIILFIFLVLFFIVSIPILLIEWMIGKFNPAARDLSCLRIVQAALRTILFISGTKTTVIGLENIPENEPVLFIGNHRGFFDIVISYTRMKDLTGFVSKKEIGNLPILHTWMVRLYCLFLDRSDIKAGLKTILQGIDYIKNKHVSIAIFPEGSRNKDEGVKPFKEGSFKFAQKTGCKIIPMAQNNTSAIFEDHFPFIKKSHTVLEFGKPIVMSELSKEDQKTIGAYTHKIVADMYEKNKALV